MRDELWAAMSFAATILFGLLALAGLLLLGLMAGDAYVVRCALAASALAYLAQMCGTFRKDVLGAWLQLAALSLWALGFIHARGGL